MVFGKLVKGKHRYSSVKEEEMRVIKHIKNTMVQTQFSALIFGLLQEVTESTVIHEAIK